MEAWSNILHRQSILISEFFVNYKNSVFVSAQLRAEYQQYVENEQSLGLFILIFGLFVGFGSTYFIIALTHLGDSRAFLLILMALIIYFILIIVITAIINQKICNSNKKSAKKSLEQIMILGITIDMGLILLAKSLTGQCSSNQFLQIWTCNNEAISHNLPQTSLIVLMLIPLLNSSFFRLRWISISLSWLCSISFILLSVVTSHSYISFSSIVVYVPLSLLIIMENRRHHLAQFYLSIKLKESLQINLELADQQARELRSVISNVAHDIKTPLSAVMSGVECVLTEISEVVSTIKSNGNITMDNPNDSGEMNETKAATIFIIIEKLQNVTSYSKSLKHIN
eukprot:gene16683-22817_t